VKDTDYDELTLGNAPTLMMSDQRYQRQLGHSDVLKLLQGQAALLMDEAFRCRALGQESAGKSKEELAKYLLSLVASLPTKLRAQ